MKIGQYSHIILDEIHDRTSICDFTTLLLRKLLSEKKINSKLILMSATMQGPLFVKYFGEVFKESEVSKPFFVGSKCYPVKQYFIDDLKQGSIGNDHGFILETQQLSQRYLSELANKNLNAIYNTLVTSGPRVILFTQEVCTEIIIYQAVFGKSILVFLPGLSEILDYFTFLDSELKGRKIDQHFSVFILHSQVPIEEQEALMLPPPANMVHVILSTNIAESSVTIPMLSVVINFGIQRFPKYDYKRKMTCLVKFWCSKAACAQRSGRVGRLFPGKVFHLFPKALYANLFPAHDPPEMFTTSLAKIVLQARQIGEKIGFNTPSEILNLAVEPPSLVQLEGALHELVSIGAMFPSIDGKPSETGKVTVLGEFSLNLTLDLDLCRLLLYGLYLNCTVEAVIIAAGLSLKQDCFTMPSRLLIKDQDAFLKALSRSIDSRFCVDNENLSDPLMFVQIFKEWVKFVRSFAPQKLSKSTLVHLFSKFYAVQPQRFLQFVSTISYIGDQIKPLFPPAHICQTHLTILLDFISSVFKNKGVGAPLINEIHFFVQPDKLRALLTAAFMRNLLYGVIKVESFNPCERQEAQIGLVSMIEGGFDIKKSIVVRQIGNGSKDAMEELAHTIVPDCPVHTSLAHSVGAIEFQSEAIDNTPFLSKHIHLFWQFCERRHKWTVANISIPYAKPFHPMEISWFRWSPQLEKVDVITWRNRTGLFCDFSDYHAPQIAIATSLEGTESHTRVKAKSLTILPSFRETKLPILLLLAFQSYTSSVMFNVDHRENVVVSVVIDSQELPFGLWQKITVLDLLIINKLRYALSGLMMNTVHMKDLPLYDFYQTDRLISCLVHPVIQNNSSDSSLNPPLPLTLADLYTDNLQPVSHLRSYFPEYRCSLLKQNFNALPFYPSQTFFQGRNSFPSASPSSSDFTNPKREMSEFNTVSDYCLQVNIGIQLLKKDCPPPLLANPPKIWHTFPASQFNISWDTYASCGSVTSPCPGSIYTMSSNPELHFGPEFQKPSVPLHRSNEASIQAQNREFVPPGQTFKKEQLCTSVDKHVNGGINWFPEVIMSTKAEDQDHCIRESSPNQKSSERMSTPDPCPGLQIHRAPSAGRLCYIHWVVVI